MFGFKTVVAAVTVATMIGSSAFAADGAFARLSRAQFGSE